MEIEERNTQIADIIRKKAQTLENTKIRINPETVEKIIIEYQKSTKTIAEIILEIEKLIQERIKNYNDFLSLMAQEAQAAKAQLNAVEVAAPAEEEMFFGESLNKQLIASMLIYEKISSQDDLTEEAKELEFTKRMAEGLALVNKTMPGINELDYNTMTKIYQKFTNDIDIIVPEWEMKMCYQEDPANPAVGITIRSDLPILNPDGLINDQIFNFSHAKMVYDFAQKHGKKLKLHTLLWHKAFPDNLKQVLIGKSPEEARQITLSFLDSYMSHVATWATEKGYDFTQIDVLNEIAYDQAEGVAPQTENPELRDSNWSRAIGKNPMTGDPYYIDVLKMARKHFPSSQLLYNEFNEYHADKCTSMCKIIEQVKVSEAREGISLLDGIGLQSHYSEYNSSQKRPTQPADVYSSMAKLTQTGKPLYRTEYDFVQTSPDDSNKQQIVNAIQESDQKCGVKGFIGWGNSDSISWLPNQKASTVKSNGDSKEEYEHYANNFSQTRKGKTLQQNKPKALVLNKPNNPDSGHVSIILLIIVIISALLFVGIGVGYFIFILQNK